MADKAMAEEPRMAEPMTADYSPKSDFIDAG